ncbi:MAG: monovalent cation/H(+) antiporter subunit G [Bacteroidetes bacterium]|nr:monovalent cation/H(+) antiporter subunit G [Bacteroidota bacterium]
MIVQYATALLLVGGALFFVVAAFGIVRFPDLYTRMHAATKGSAFGVVLMMLGVALHFRDIWVTTESLLVILFVFLTAPIAAYAIARAAHTMRTPMAKETVIDELKEREKK